MAFAKSQVRNKRGKNVTPTEHKMVVNMALHCLRELSKAEYELPKFQSKIIVQTKCRGQRSYGGAFGITIDLSRYRKGDVYLNEYKSYQDCNIIGSAKCDNPETMLLAIVAHEIAHHVQHRYCLHKFGFAKPHGDGFKRLYGYLRRALINQSVEHTGVQNWSIATRAAA